VAADALDLPRLADWLTACGEAVTPPLDAALIPGGRSNLTFHLTDGQGHRWVLRRPPMGPLLPTAHDMARESRIMRALQPTAVPVPAVIGYAEDVLPVPCYLMAYVDGAVLRTSQDASRLEPEARHRIGLALVDTLAHLHAVDPDEVGLGDLGRRDDYVGRQLRRWWRQWQQQHERDRAIVEEVHAGLAACVPPQHRTGIVHGDYKLDNVITGADGDLRAVLDWELSTLGDPLADLGTFLAYTVDPPSGPLPVVPTNTRAPGFPTRAELVGRYAGRTGADVDRIDYFVALGYWKLAVIYEGVRARTLAGAYGDQGRDTDLLADAVEAISEAARDALQRDREG
jgi:aminoglycoside phosphotransferase (APT) family kinase protein